jgi:serine/threonine protein kinase/Tol biopolymer transport system component
LSLTPGTRLGVFQVVDLIGRGGMGEVYRATDTKLKRQVAIKVLPPSLVADPDRLARFQREAEVLASLNHPNIAAIYGLEESEGVTALVMELVEGDDLSHRIAQGAIPIDEALPIARQIAEALEAAHEQGIIHRDLKPANIKVRPDGTVKVLDFGLAKALEPTGGLSSGMSQMPTITTPAMTQAGMILGTAAYMSPEQARGKVVDRRADIWAFGAVLYEMLTGQRAFGGDDVSEVLSRVLQREPEWTALPSELSPTLIVYLRRCLHRDLQQRIGDIHDVRLALDGAFETAAPQTTAPTGSAPSGGRLVWVASLGVAAVVILALAIPAVRYLRQTPPHETRVEINTPPTDTPTSFALSPDGRQIVFVASGDGASRLWVRPLDKTTAQPLAGTERASFPFWSPDSRSVGFFADGELKRLDLGGGAAQTLAPATTGSGGTWSADGVIVFAPSRTTVLMRVSATGGPAVAVTTLGPEQVGQIAPSFLADGRRFLFYQRGGSDGSGIYLGALDANAPTRLTPAAGGGVLLPSGWLLWVRAGTQTLVAQRLDVDKAALTGESVTVAEGVAVDGNLSAVSVAATGLAAYRMGTGGQRQLTWFDRLGTAQGTIGDPDATLSNPRVSPDGRRVVVERTAQRNTDLWLLDATRTSRFTFDPATDYRPLWSPDGTQIVFSSNRAGAADLYQKLASGAGSEERIVASDQIKIPSSWSSDGRFLIFYSVDQQTEADLWVAPMQGGRAPSVFLKTPFGEAVGVFSPDGRWVAYQQANESGGNEVYVRPFVPPGAADTAAGVTGSQWQVSTAGGFLPVWRPDGKELYYISLAREILAAPIAVVGNALEPGAPVVLFATRIVGGGGGQIGRNYDIAPDGRFLINTELPGDAAPITLLMNWQPDARQ